MTVILAKIMDDKYFGAAVKALPTHPHRLNIQFFGVDYSPIAAQLRTIPYLKKANFSFDPLELDPMRLDLAVVKNPTKQMVIDIYKPQKRDFEKPGAAFASVEWDYDHIVYELKPNQNVFRARDSSRRYAEIPAEVKLEDILESYKGVLKEDFEDLRREQWKDTTLIVEAKDILKDFCPNSVTITSQGVSVRYKDREPSYLPALVKALNGSGNLTIMREL